MNKQRNEKKYNSKNISQAMGEVFLDDARESAMSKNRGELNI